MICLSARSPEHVRKCSEGAAGHAVQDPASVKNVLMGLSEWTVLQWIFKRETAR